jgi:hypothetical protein
MKGLFYRYTSYGLRLSVLFATTMMIYGCANNNVNSLESYSLTAAANKPETSVEANGAASTQTIKVALKNVTLWDLNLNDSGNQVRVKPGSIIHAKIYYAYHCSDCYKSLNNQIIIGLARRSAQACIYDGGSDGEGVAEFTLKAPAKPGKYEVRFRGLQSANCQIALKTGWNADNSPTKATTLGMIVASKKSN